MWLSCDCVYWCMKLCLAVCSLYAGFVLLCGYVFTCMVRLCVICGWWCEVVYVVV